MLAVLLVASLPPILLRPSTLSQVAKLNFIDDSWLLDASYKAASGIWFGRDVAFTFGPAFQWLSSAPSRSIGTSIGAVLATWYTLPFAVVILATFFTARLLLPQASPWRRALLVPLAVIFWLQPDVRTSLCLLAFAIFVRLTDAMAAPGGMILPAAIAAAMICSLAFLVSADTGIYTITALLLCLAAMAIVTRRKRRIATFLALVAIVSVLLILLINSLLLSPLNFTFWRSSLAIAGGYRWFEPIAMAKADKRLLLKTLALSIVVFGAAGWLRKPDALTRKPVFLLSGFGLAFVMMQSALVRSDHGHVLVGIYPMIFLCGAIAIDEAGIEGLWSLGPAAVAVIVTIALAHPFGLFVPHNAWERLRQVTQPVTSCQTGAAEFDYACFPVGDANLLKSVSDDVHKNAGVTDRIAVFPYETAFGLASRRQVAGGVLQSYLLNGAYLTELELSGLRKTSPPVGLYFPDGIISIPLDGVPNFTRSPEVWFYLLRHYRAAGSPAPGVMELTRDDGREPRLAFAEEKIAGAMAPVRITRRNTTLDLGAVAWPSEGADFLKLRLRIQYPFWWRLRKPSCLTLQMSFADGSKKSLQFLAEPNRESDLWVYPWDETLMGGYFEENESAWPRAGHPQLTGLKLLVTPFDWISVAPLSVAVEDIEGVRLSVK